MIFYKLISSVLNERKPPHNIWFAGDFYTPSPCSYQVDFPRLQLVLEGEYVNEMESHEGKITNVIAQAGDAIFIPANCWNKPIWNTDCSVLTILFSRCQLGLSLVSKRKEEEGFYDIQKHSVQNCSGFAIENILEALSSLARDSNKKPMDELLLQALLQYSKTMLEAPAEKYHNRGQNMYQGICIYIQENFHRKITRDSIALRFSISSNYLSRMFREQGNMTLAEYITRVRVERAKFMLQKYKLKLNEVALRSGYKDVNYFCRVFKNRTGQTPTEYRGPS